MSPKNTQIYKMYNLAKKKGHWVPTNMSGCNRRQAEIRWRKTDKLRNGKTSLRTF